MHKYLTHQSLSVKDLLELQIKIGSFWMAHCLKRKRTRKHKLFWMLLKPYCSIVKHFILTHANFGQTIDFQWLPILMVPSWLTVIDGLDTSAFATDKWNSWNCESSNLCNKHMGTTTFCKIVSTVFPHQLLNCQSVLSGQVFSSQAVYSLVSPKTNHLICCLVNVHKSAVFQGSRAILIKFTFRDIC
jgi:hypothetical protein